MNEQELSKFIPQDAIFVRSVLDGKNGTFKIWFQDAKNGALETMKFLRRNGHWIFRAESAVSVGH